MAVHAHGSLRVWDKLQPVARGAGHHPGPASCRPFPPMVAGPAGGGTGMAPVPSALHGAAPSPSPFAAPWGLAATPRCFTTRHAQEPGKLAER